MGAKHRILYIVTEEPDYGQDMVYAGLVRVLGVENVLETPFHLGYHIRKKVYPRDLGYVPGTFFWRATRRASTFTPTAVIVASCKPRCMAHYLELLPSLSGDIPHIFIDGGDYSELGGDLTRLGAPDLWKKTLKKRPFDLILKREKLLTKEYDSSVVAFPYAVQTARLPALPIHSKYDVTFWAVESDPIRTHALTMLETRYDCASNGTTRGQTFRKYSRKGKQYLAELAASKIVLNLRGVGHDTLRYWEAPALATCMVSTQPPIELPYNFVHNEHAVFVAPDLSDLIPTLDALRSDPERRARIGKAGREHALKHHTHIQRAKQLLGYLDDILETVHG
jgi:hypothetical protein